MSGSRPLPEYPDITVYLEALAPRVVGQPLEARAVGEPVPAALGRSAARARPTASGWRALGGSASASCSASRSELFLVLHLMIAGRLRWTAARRQARRARSAWRRSTSQTARCSLTEAGTKKRASLHLVRGEAALAAHRSAAGSRCWTPTSTRSRGARAREPHAQARAHRSAPVQRHRQRVLGRDPAPRAALAGRSSRGSSTTTRSRGCSTRRATTLLEWTERLRREAGDGFPEKVTAFRAGDGGARPLPPALPGRAARRCSASSTPRTRPTTARAARPAASCSRIARSRGS